ncbi:hypothetical protein [Limosilactobacillus reuteri]|uniref:hypothetical protein n=1 Tax=Limosilactobacillus reuteri TaxID=1598 RepID=UPI001094E13E|nr:hypothetical protein [Limosilactobacillus reuteri]TGY58099.1 hypothetical protein E5337_08005 [Limosilactobacillus reuteri]
MNNNELLVQTARELAARLSNTEIDRASFRAQAIGLQNENDQLKKQIEELKAKLPKEDEDTSKPKTDETEQDPQANK